MTETADRDARTIQLATGALSYTDAGEGPVILAIHGLPGDRHDFQEMAPLLRRRHRVLCVDLPGFGASSAVGGVWSYQKAADLLCELVERLEVQPVILGYSFGGTIAIQVAARTRGRSRALCLLASLGLRPHRFLREAPIRTLSGVLRVPGARFLLARPLRRAYKRARFRDDITDWQRVLSIHYLASVAFDAQRRAVASIEVPTFAAWGNKDRLIQAEISSELADALPPGPRLALDEGGHTINKTAAVPLSSAIEAWIATLV